MAIVGVGMRGSALGARVSTTLAASFSGLAIVAIGCGSLGGSGPKATGSGAGAGSASSASAGGGAAGSGSGADTGAGGSIVLNTAGAGGDAGVGGGGDGGGRPPRCDDAGNCTCINIASIGLPGMYGVTNDNTNQFQTWLNTKSSANVDMITTRTTLTPALLAKYDVILLQELADAVGGPYWQFTQPELDALTAWVQNGGGLIALTGYDWQAEVTPLNQLLAFTGISYNMDNILGGCTNNEPCYCWGNTVPVGGWLPASPISASVTQIGAFQGHSINAGSNATVVSTDGTTKYAVSEQVESGRVFAYCDEWITYTSQWDGTGATNPSDPCYMKGASQVFQVAQFWYNVIKWASSNAGCFTINDPTITK